LILTGSVQVVQPISTRAIFASLIQSSVSFLTNREEGTPLESNFVYNPLEIVYFCKLAIASGLEWEALGQF
jgi:hypothetical protein